MAKQIHCVNCFLLLRSQRNIQLREETPEVQNLVATWIHPMQVGTSENDKICVKCRNLALEVVEDPEKALVDSWPPRGHKRICIMCGCSTLRMVYVYPAIRESWPRDEQLRYARIVAVKIAPRQLKPYHEICKPCYMKILRKHPRARPTPIKEHYVSGEDHVGEQPEVQVIKIEQLDPLRDFRVPNNNPIVKAEAESDDEHNVIVDTTLNPKEIKKEIDTDFTSQQRDIISEIYDVSNAHLLTEESVNAYTVAIKEGSVNAYTAAFKEKEKSFTITTVDETEKYEQPAEKDKPQELEQENEVKQLDRITLPTIRRSVMTSRRCVFDDCAETKLMPIPDYIRIQILINFRHFIHRRAKVCINHLKSNSFYKLCASPKNFDSFTSEQIQEMLLLPLRKPFSAIPNFDAVEENEDDLIEYWTGVDKEMFVKILSITKLDKVRRGGTGLAALLCKLRTEDSIKKLSKVFGLNKNTIHVVILKAKQGMAKHPECIDMVCSQLSNNKRRLFKSYIKRGPKLRNGEKKAMQLKKDFDRDQLLTKSVLEHTRLEVPIAPQSSENSTS